MPKTIAVSCLSREQNSSLATRMSAPPTRAGPAHQRHSQPGINFTKNIIKAYLHIKEKYSIHPTDPRNNEPSPYSQDTSSFKAGIHTTRRADEVNAPAPMNASDQRPYSAGSLIIPLQRKFLRPSASRHMQKIHLASTIFQRQDRQTPQISRGYRSGRPPPVRFRERRSRSSVPIQHSLFARVWLAEAPPGPKTLFQSPSTRPPGGLPHQRP